MSQTLLQVQKLIQQGEVRVSEHGYDELAADGMLAKEVIAGMVDAVTVEDSPDYPKGPCVLVRQRDSRGGPIHSANV